MKKFFKYAFASAFGFFIAGILIFGVFIFVITVALSQMEKKSYSLKEGAVLHLNLSGEIMERAPENPLGELFADYQTAEMGLDDILAAIDKAEKSPEVKGIFLEMNNPMGGLATFEEIRNRLTEFKLSGKFVVAYGDVYGQKDYFLASVAKPILINPIGTIDFRGLGGEPVFFKKALDKLGVEMQIFKVGTYKSAVEPFTSEKMSDANRLQVTEYLNELWGHMVKNISISRKISEDSLQLYANKGITLARTEVFAKLKFVDKLVYRTDAWKEIQKLAKTDAKEEDVLVSVADINRVPAKANSAEDEVALVYASGGIDDGDSNGINSGALVEELAKLKADSAVKAVVVRVNSPGGSAFGSEQIWHEIVEIKKAKPVIISMGDYAASGGYYISCPATAIVAQPTTITGSIGIFGMFPNLSGLTDKLGLTFDEVSTNKYATTPSTNRPMRADEKILFQSYIERGYDLFVTRCADGRRFPKERIEGMAQGRVWTGEKALQLGLIDQFGGIRTAIKLAASKAKIKNYRIESYPQKENVLDKLLKDVSSEASLTMAKMYFGENFKHYVMLKNIQRQDRMQARIPYSLEIE